ncbi:putative holin-like toxin [Lactobacillus ultunensis]
MLSITDALQLMLLFGTLIINLIALVVELIKNHQQKNNRLSSGKLAVI